MRVGASTIVRMRAGPVFLDWAAVAVAGGGALLAGGTAASQGGYFPESSAWLTLAGTAVTGVCLLLAAPVTGSRLAWGFVLGLLGLAALTGASAAWAPSPTLAIEEGMRVFAYAAVTGALVCTVTRSRLAALAAGTLAGVTVVSGYALLTRVLPDVVGAWDPVGGYRLAAPIGYWNGLGIYAALGLVLAFGVAARSGSRLGQALAGATTLVLAPTVLFTFSRGAWLGLAAGVVFALVVDTRRVQLGASLLAVGIWPAVALAAASRAPHLTHGDVTPAQAATEGRSYLWLLAALAVFAAATAVGVRALDHRLVIPAHRRRTTGAIVLVLAVVACAAVVARYGSPWSLAERGWTAFASAEESSGPNVGGRLLGLSSNGRLAHWEVALDQFRAAPLTGEGAGSYWNAWYRLRPTEFDARDAHSLYLETLGELGLVGLALLATTLAVPLLGLRRARRSPLFPSFAACYAAYLVHAGVDWDWEQPGVTVVALAAATALVIAGAATARSAGAPRRAWRRPAAMLAALLAVPALYGVAFEVPAGRARTAYDRLDFEQARREAVTAVERARWSSEALKRLGRAELALGRVEAARSAFERALEHSPQDFELWRDLAVVAPPDRALEAIRIYRTLNPRDVDEVDELERRILEERAGA